LIGHRKGVVTSRGHKDSRTTAADGYGISGISLQKNRQRAVPNENQYDILSKSCAKVLAAGATRREELKKQSVLTCFYGHITAGEQGQSLVRRGRHTLKGKKINY